MKLVGSIGFLVLIATSSVRGEHLFLLRSSGGQLVIERTELMEGQERVISCDAASGVIDVIFPVGPGGSGSLARFADERTITAKRVGDEISVLDKARSGKQWQRPTRTLDDLRSQDIRVSVISHEGLRKAFLVRGYADVTPDPVEIVVDLFAGKIPTQPGDHVIHTETFRSRIEVPIEGVVPFEYDKYMYAGGTLEGGRKGLFVIDLGAGQTFVTREFLPAIAEITDVGVAQYSTAGKEILKYAPQGATGATAVLGSAKLPRLSLGELTYTDAIVAVMPKLPELGGRRVDGIIGLDLLRRNRFLTIEYGVSGSGGGFLRLHSAEGGVSHALTSVPFALINSHIVVQARVNSAPVAFIVDTGAPVCFLDAQAATTVGLGLEESPSKTISGIGAGSISARTTRIPELRVAEQTLTGVDAMTGALPVFAPLRGHDQSVGLLGNTVLSQLGRTEIDFSTNQIRFSQ